MDQSGTTAGVLFLQQRTVGGGSGSCGTRRRHAAALNPVRNAYPSRAARPGSSAGVGVEALTAAEEIPALGSRPKNSAFWKANRAAFQERRISQLGRIDPRAGSAIDGTIALSLSPGHLLPLVPMPPGLPPCNLGTAA